MKVYFLQRMLAYLIDSIIVLLIATMLTFYIPITDKYEEALNESNEVMDLYLNSKISVQEYLERTGEANYTIASETMIITFVNLVVTVAYFGTYSYYKDGQTIGKKLMKFKIVGDSLKNPSHLTFIFRSVIIHGVIFNAISFAFLKFISSNQYMYMSGAINLIYILFLLVSVFMIMFRKDGKGLHDLMFKTKAVGLK